MTPYSSSSPSTSSSDLAFSQEPDPSALSPGAALPAEAMQPTGGDMPGMTPSMLNGSAPQVALHEMQNRQPEQQRRQAPTSALQDYDHSAAATHDDLFDQMVSSLPWVELNPANSKSPWDLAAANGATEAAAAKGQKLYSVSLGGKPAMEEQATGVEGLHYAPPYDESVLLASRLRQHQISGGGGGPPGPGKPAVSIQLNHASQQQHMLVAGMGRSAGESGLLSLPLSLGSGDSADSRILLDRSRGDVDPSFKSLTSAVGEGLFNRFGGSLQRAVPPATANQQSFHHPQAGAVTSQILGTAGQAPAAGSAAGGAAPPRQRVRARRGQATDPHSIAERLRRERIAERMKALQELVPSADKTDKASMLDEIIDYVKFLQHQVKVLSMSRLGGAAAVVPLVADMLSSEAGAGRGSAAGGDGLTATEHQVAKLMEDDIGSAMQYLQGKGLCLMPVSLASAISATAGHPRAAAGPLPNGGSNNQNGSLLVPNADAPSSPSMSVLTVQSAMANGGDASAKDSASVSKP